MFYLLKLRSKKVGNVTIFWGGSEIGNFPVFFNAAQAVFTFRKNVATAEDVLFGQRRLVLRLRKPRQEIFIINYYYYKCENFFKGSMTNIPARLIVRYSKSRNRKNL